MKATKRLGTKSVVFGLLLVSLVAFASGCTPRGYFANSGGERPIIYVGNHLSRPPSVAIQFPDLNYNNYWQGDTSELHFIFEQQLHLIKITRASPLSAMLISIEVTRDEVLLGGFVDIPEDWRVSGRYAMLGFVFLHESYIYYHLLWSRTVFHPFRHGFRHPVTRYEYYRFNLLTGQNEQITLTQYVETLQIYNSNFIINPEWSGER